MQSDKKVERMFKRICHMKQYKKLTDSQIMDKAKEIIRRDETNNDVVSQFKDKAEKKIGKDLLDKYLEDYSLETISDKNTLKEIIYLEVVQSRLQEKLDDMYSKDSKAVPINILEIIHKNSDAIMKLKNSLGLNKSKEKKTSYDALQHLRQRYRKWREENQGSRTLKCPLCQKFVLLKIRMDAWDAQKHPFFKDNFLYNQHLFENLGKQITVDRDFIAKVMECSPDYIDNIQKRVKVQFNEPKEVLSEVLSEEKDKV